MIELIVRYGPIVGYLMVFGIIFAESGLLVGFFLPGDSLLFTAGFLASPASAVVLNKLGANTSESFFLLPLLLIGCFLAAVIGDSVGYLFGKRVGVKLFQREDSMFFSQKNINRAQAFYDQHGGKAIVLARFIPIVRTFAPIVAGIGSMNYRRFLAFNLLGGLMWAVGVTLLGYFLAAVIGPENVDKYLLPIVAVIVMVSVAPPIYHVLKEKESREALRHSLLKMIGRAA